MSCGVSEITTSPMVSDIVANTIRCPEAVTVGSGGEYVCFLAKQIIATLALASSVALRSMEEAVRTYT